MKPHLDCKPSVIIIVALTVVCFSACESPVSPGGGGNVPGVTPTSSALTPSSTAAARVSQDFPFKKILCFGDSLTFGVTLQAGPDASSAVRPILAFVEGYVPKLGRLLTEEHGEGIELVNAGISGENAEEGLDRIDTEIRRHDPDLILLLQGILDVNNEAPRFGKVESTLAETMRIGQLRGVAIIVGTYPLLNPGGYRTRGAEHIPRLNRIIREEAVAKDIPVADHEEAFPADFSGMGSDGLHPNDIGYRIMAQTWFEVIDAMVGGGT